MVINSIRKFSWLLVISLLAICFVPQIAHAAIPDTPLTSFPSTNNRVDVTVAAPDGSVYIGGSFSDVGGTTRNGLAHILADGSLGMSFNPNISGEIIALALNPTTNTLYVGGAFNDVNAGTTRNNLAALNASTGVATSFNPDMNDYVRALVLDSSTNTLYAGGWFTQVNGGTSRAHLVAVDTGTAIATGFAPNPNDAVEAILLDSANNVLYIGRFFTGVNGGTTRNPLAAFSSTNDTLTSFDPNTPNGVDSLVLDLIEGTLYAGGGFTTVNV